MWTLNGIDMVEGDCPQGYRHATAEEVTNYEASKAKADLVSESLAYLASTDWYYARLAETGQPVPQDVVDKRKAAREYLNQ